MSHNLVVLMLRTGIPFTTWLDQPDGVIETAVRLINEQDQRDNDDDPPAQGWSG